MLRLLTILTLASSLPCSGQTYKWANDLGSASYEEGNSIAIDSLGNVYCTGHFRTTVDFDPSGNTANLTSNGSSDMFVAKYDANGNYLWAFNVGGTNSDNGTSIVIVPGGSGAVHITGAFSDTADFDPSGNTANLISNGGSDIFLAKYDANGNYLWAFSVGGVDGDAGNRISNDNSGNTYLLGSFNSALADFDPSANVANLTSIGLSDVFVAKYDVTGNYLWAFSIGSSGLESGWGIDFYPSGSGGACIVGLLGGTADFDPSGNTANLTSSGSTDIFVARYDANGNYVWAFKVGGSGSDYGWGMACDTAGNSDIYVTGHFENTIDFDPSGNIANLVANSSGDMFVAKYDINGNYLWALDAGGTSGDHGYSIVTDPGGSGDAYVTGGFKSTADFDPSFNIANLTSNGSSDIFIAKYDSSGNYKWAFQIGGNSQDNGWSIATDTSGKVFVTGEFRSTADFDPGANFDFRTSAGNNDIFIAKYCDDPIVTVSNDTVICNGDSVTLAATGGITYQWSPGNGLSDSTIASPVASPATSTTYSVIATTDCSSDTGYTTITVNPTYDISDTQVVICNGDSALLYGNYESIAGTYYDSLFTVGGCDSVHSTVLSVDPTYNINDSIIQICIGDSVLIYGNYEAVSGTYYDSLTTVCGVDSVHSTILTVNPTYNFNDTPIDICIGDSALVYGNYESTSGTFYDSIMVINGCDSIYSTVLTVNPTSSGIDSISIPQGDSILLGGAYQTTPGIYYDTLTAANDCDSILATTLIVTVGIDEYGSSSFIIHPNPTTGFAKIMLNDELLMLNKIKVLDLYGRAVPFSIHNSTLNIQHLPAGVYFVKVGEAVRKVVVQ